SAHRARARARAAAKKHTSGKAGSDPPPAGPDECLRAVHNKLHVSRLLRSAQCLAKIFQDVFCSLETYRDTYQFLSNAGGGKRGRVHLLVCRAGRMDHQGLGIADIGEVAREPRRLDELSPGGTVAFDAEADDGTSALWQQLLCQCIVWMRFQRGM